MEQLIRDLLAYSRVAQPESLVSDGNENVAAPPSLSITAETLDGESIVTVRDNGIGFEQQYAERIFKLFKRLHRDEYPGTGLGLAICQRIVERCHARIWAESEPGAGSAFFIALQSASAASV
jgi:light-regulated signal transduction histidine kinase (bacteriophytochrome)